MNESDASDISFSVNDSRKRVQVGKFTTTNRKFGKLNSSARAVCSSRNYVVEHFGPHMPIAVTESLINSPEAKGNATVSVNPDCGWGWYVFGRKLLVWPVVPSKEKVPPMVLSRELSLPSSDLAHSANLVAVYVEPGNQAASCMAVSPEGTVRYWQTIGQHNSWFDTNTQLGGEEVCAVRYVPPLGCLAVTTSASMILLTTSVVKGMPVVTTTHVSVRDGWINSIGRKMSSVIFGLLPPSQGLETKIVKVLTRQRHNSSWHIFLMSGLSLQSWNIGGDGQNNMYYECDLTYMMKEAFEVTHREDSEITFLDMRYSETGLMFLAVCSKPRSYIIVEFLMGNEKTAPKEYVKHCELSKQDLAALGEITDKVGSNLQFLPLTASALVFNNRIICGIPFGVRRNDGDDIQADRIDIPDNYVLGGQMYQGIPIFFTTTYGFVSVSSIDSSSLDVMNSSTVGDTTSASFFESDDKSSATKKDYLSAAKTAFIHYVRKNTTQCKAVIAKEFPAASPSNIDSPLATTLIKLSLNIIDDIAAKDPRWGEAKNFPSLPGAASLDLEKQLLEKLNAHDHFLRFVKDLSLTEQLGRVNRKNHPSPVKPVHILHEHNEKIACALALYKVHERFRPLVDKIIKVTCKDHNFQPSLEISCHDYLFRHVSIIDDWIRNLCEECAKSVPSQIDELQKFVDLALETNTLLVEILQAVITKSSSRGSQYIDPSFLPWLTAPGNRGLFDYLMKQMNLSYNLVLDHNVTISEQFVEQMFLLCDVILFSQKEYSTSQKFVDLRAKLIRPFVLLKELGRAVQLAEKYKDFEVLIEVCYQEDYTPRLLQYMQRYEDEGFSETMFQWFLKRNKKSELLHLDIPPEFNEKLSVFLENCPSIAWLHTVKLQDLSKTKKMLVEYGTRSNAKYAIKVERALALAKMACLAADSNDQMLPDITARLEVLHKHKQLKNSLLESYGFTRRSIRPLSPSELVQLFISEENVEGTEKDFLSALMLLPYVEPKQAQTLKVEIWVRAILKDSWADLDPSSPLDAIQKLLVFRLMELVILTEADPVSLVPTIKEIMSHDDLSNFSHNTLFRYILIYGYEHYMEPISSKKKKRSGSDNEDYDFMEMEAFIK